MLEGRITRQLVVSLLNHIKAFSDWAQCFVLELVARYQPASEEERFDILEVGPCLVARPCPAGCVFLQLDGALTLLLPTLCMPPCWAASTHHIFRVLTETADRTPRTPTAATPAHLLPLPRVPARCWTLG